MGAVAALMVSIFLGFYVLTAILLARLVPEQGPQLVSAAMWLMENFYQEENALVVILSAVRVQVMGRISA